MGPFRIVRRIMKRRHACRLLILGLALLASCVNPEEAFREAESIDTIEAYESFLDRFPNTPLSAKARARAAAIAYRNASAENSEEAYEEFVRSYPDSEQAQLARDLAETVAYDALIENFSEEAVERFMAKYPDSERALLRQLDRAVVKNVRMVVGIGDCIEVDLDGEPVLFSMDHALAEKTGTIIVRDDRRYRVGRLRGKEVRILYEMDKRVMKGGQHGPDREYYVAVEVERLNPDPEPPLTGSP